MFSRTLKSLHDKYAIVPADKAPNNFVFVWKVYYHQCLVNEFGSTNTYLATALIKEEILQNHKSVISAFGINIDQQNQDVSKSYWIPKLHKHPYEQSFIVGSAKCSTKGLSHLLTTLLAAVKNGLQSYFVATYSRNGINQMWIMKSHV